MDKLSEKAGQDFSSCFNLTGQTVTYQLDLQLAHTCSKFYRDQAARAKVGQALSLVYSSSAGQITVLHEGQPLGRLYAADAAHLLLLFDFYQQRLGWLDFLQQDLSRVTFVQTGPLRPEDKGRRFPKLALRLCLVLPQAWPLFVITAMLQIKAKGNDLARLVLLNPWLAPLLHLQRDYRRQGHDGFILPELISRSWLWLTGQTDNP